VGVMHKLGGVGVEDSPHSLNPFPRAVHWCRPPPLEQEEDAKAMVDRMMEEKFDFNDFLKQVGAAAVRGCREGRAGSGGGGGSWWLAERISSLSFGG
jgi:hypothetical protein